MESVFKDIGTHQAAQLVERVGASEVEVVVARADLVSEVEKKAKG